MKHKVANFLLLLTGIASAKTPNVVIMFMDDMGYAISELLERSPTYPNSTEWPRGKKIYGFLCYTSCVFSIPCRFLTVVIMGDRHSRSIGSKSNIGISPNEVTTAEICKQRDTQQVVLENGIWDIIRNSSNSMDSMNILVYPIQTICGLTIQVFFIYPWERLKMATPSINRRK